MKKNSTWRALLFSMFSMLICATMLIGSTWAWFTATASLGTTAILSGTLNIEIVKADDSPLNAPLQFIDDNTMMPALWEPGKTFRTESFKIKNAGNLSLKYTLSVAVPPSELNKVINFTLVTLKPNGEIDQQLPLATEGILPVTGESPIMYIVGSMQIDADSKYQGLTIDALTITVTATQSTLEPDSFNNGYDQNAQFDPSAGLGNENADAGEDDASE